MRMRHADFLRHEQDAAARMAGISPAALGDRLRIARQRQGLSIRVVADRAGLSKTSVVRAEQGKPCEPSTVVKLCAALGLHLAALVKPESARAATARHTAEDDRWFDLTSFGTGPLGGHDRPLTAGERAVFAKSGVAIPLNVLRSRLPGGRLLSTVLELHAPSPTRSHAGEEFVYVLEGRAVITVAGVDHTLGPGDSLAFRSAEPHRYAPAPRSKRPPRVLSVRLDDRA